MKRANTTLTVASDYKWVLLWQLNCGENVDITRRRGEMHDEVDIYDRDPKPIALGRHSPRPAGYHGTLDNHHTGIKNWSRSASGVPDPHFIPANGE